MKKKFWMVEMLSPYDLESDFDNLIADLVNDKVYDASSTSNAAVEFIFKKGSDLANEILKYTTPHLLELEMNDFVEGIFTYNKVSRKVFFHNETGGEILAVPKILYQYVCRECLHNIDGENIGLFPLEKINNNLDYLKLFTSYTLSKKIRLDSDIQCKCQSRNFDFQNLMLQLPSQDGLKPFIDKEACILDFKNNHREYLYFFDKKKDEKSQIHSESNLHIEETNMKLLFEHLRNEILIIKTDNPFISKDEGFFQCILSYKQYENSSLVSKEDFLSSVKIELISYYGFSLINAFDTLKIIEESLGKQEKKKSYKINLKNLKSNFFA